MASPQAKPGLLNSWKEIAAYLGRGLRTVQRWEKDAGLPVRRLASGPRAPVVADASDIDHWLTTANARRVSNTRPAPPTVSPTLRDSMIQAHALREEMLALRVAGHQQLVELVASIEQLTRLCSVHTPMLQTPNGKKKKGNGAEPWSASSANSSAQRPPQVA